jgi:hypothetical protein
LSATIIDFDQRYRDRQDESVSRWRKPTASTPTMSLSRFPFPSTSGAARALGAMARFDPRAIPLDFRPFAGDLALYFRGGMVARLVARLTRLPGVVEAFFAGWLSVTIGG